VRSIRPFTALAVAALIGGVCGSARAQPPGRIATTPHALVTSAVFFHGKQIAVRAKIADAGDQSRVEIPIDEAAVAKRSTPPQLFVFWRERPPRNEGEIRGEFWDLGRVAQDDGRFSSYDFKRMLEIATNGRWPARDEVYVILGATMLESTTPATASVRSIVLTPEAYTNHEVTLSGRFRGRNLYGDLPGPLNKSKWDFVLQSADAGIWISGLRPRGRGFDLDPGARVDTGRWLTVAGTVRVEGNNVWLEAKTIEQSAPVSEAPVEVEVPVTPKEAPPTVVFSAPVPDDTGVERTTTVRIQFSRDMDPKSFKDHVRVVYVPPAQGQTPEPPNITTRYNPGNLGLEIKFAAPLERFQTVRVELLEGITAANGDPLAPWTLTFSVGS
jgi:Big-like domain-containing protein